jgi:hypothetical protein
VRNARAFRSLSAGLAPDDEERTTSNEELDALIRTISDVPKPGIQCRDVTTLLLVARVLRGD